MDLGKILVAPFLNRPAAKSFRFSIGGPGWLWQAHARPGGVPLVGINNRPRYHCLPLSINCPAESSQTGYGNQAAEDAKPLPVGQLPSQQDSYFSAKNPGKQG